MGYYGKKYTSTWAVGDDVPRRVATALQDALDFCRAYQRSYELQENCLHSRLLQTKALAARRIIFLCRLVVLCKHCGKILLGFEVGIGVSTPIQIEVDLLVTGLVMVATYTIWQHGIESLTRAIITLGGSLRI